MQLKVKSSEWSTGMFVVAINTRDAQKIGVHAGERILLKTQQKKEIGAIVDISEEEVKEGQIQVSAEIKKELSLREGQKVGVEFLLPPISADYIREKLNGKVLSSEKIKQIIKDVVENNLSEPEVSLFISSMYLNGMNFDETVALIEGILYSGDRMNFRKKLVVDKHCIGGIAGNRTTPLVVSICAAAGLTFPKTSSRAITSAAGTADTVEVLSPVEFPMDKLKKIVKKSNACLAWGGAVGMVPADSKIIKIEKMLRLDPPAQLLASIMSKKIASGSKYILIDIPYGPKAKVTKEKAKYLKKKFEALGEHFGIVMKVVLTKPHGPIGKGVGPALEIRDCMAVMNPEEKGPEDLRKKGILLAGYIFEMTGVSKKGTGIKKAEEILNSGLAWKKFKEIIVTQGGKIKKIIPSEIKKEIVSEKSGKIKEIDNNFVNYLARISGCPGDKYAGVYLNKSVGEKVKKGEVLLTLYAESESRLKEAYDFYLENKKIVRY